jgi:thymidylate synthase
MTVVYDHMVNNGITEDSRNGKVISLPHPLTICYTRPDEQVNFCPERDANPFFHFMEKLWFLEGIGDTELICRFLPRMVEYSDDGKKFNAHYGRRAIYDFGFNQLRQVIYNLREDPTTRRAVVQIWSPADLRRKSKDLACNMQLLFRVINGKLDMTVFNRSNDAIWGGVSGANITNLFVFQEYVAAGLGGISIGKQYVVSNNLHLYLDNPKTKLLLNKYTNKTTEWSTIMAKSEPYSRSLVQPMPMITDFKNFDGDLAMFMNDLRYNTFPKRNATYYNDWFNTVAVPVVTAYYNRTLTSIAATDWRLAIKEWLDRRQK